MIRFKKRAGRAGGGVRRGAGRIPATAAVFLLVLSLRAQQAPQQPSGEDAQQPGAGAQVHTGTSSGFDADTRIRNLLADHQYGRVEAQLGELPAQDAQIYRGILANRSNDPQKSISLLEPLVDAVAASGNWTQEKLVRKALAEDYLRMGDWAHAAAAYQALDTRLAGRLSADERDEIEMPVKMLPLAAHNPAMTVDACDPFEMQVSRDPLGLIDVPVWVDARPHSWMLDPTAPFNLIALSLAKEAGLTVSAETATIHTLTGRTMQVHTAVVPRFTIGGVLTLRNMTAFVFDDKDYYFPRTGYQVEGVLGYPALEALGSLTVTGDAKIFVDPRRQSAAIDDAAKGVPFYVDGDQIIVPLGVAGESAAEPKDAEERMYAIDAGGQQTYLTSRYYDEHSDEFEGRKAASYALPGQSALAPVPAYIAESAAFIAGGTPFALHFIPVLTRPLGDAARDDVYGVLGLDALDQLRGYRFDYRTMRFSVETR